MSVHPDTEELSEDSFASCVLTSNIVKELPILKGGDLELIGLKVIAQCDIRKHIHCASKSEHCVCACLRSVGLGRGCVTRWHIK